jgi:LysR family transcriptional activator for leuABCD operon
VLAIPLKLPPVPIYMVWHETRRNDNGHRWLRELVSSRVAALRALIDSGAFAPKR